MMENQIFTGMSNEVLLSLVIIVIVIFLMGNFIKKFIGGIVGFMIVGLVVITFLAALSFIPTETPEPFDLPQDEIRDCVESGAFCGEFIYDVWDWEMPGN